MKQEMFLTSSVQLLVYLAMELIKSPGSATSTGSDTCVSWDERALIK